MPLGNTALLPGQGQVDHETPALRTDPWQELCVLEWSHKEDTADLPESDRL